MRKHSVTVLMTCRRLDAAVYNPTPQVFGLMALFAAGYTMLIMHHISWQVCGSNHFHRTYHQRIPQVVPQDSHRKTKPFVDDFPNPTRRTVRIAYALHTTVSCVFATDGGCPAGPSSN